MRSNKTRGGNSNAEINECSKTPEILDWMQDLTRVEIVAIAVLLNNRTAYRVPTSGTQDQLIYGMRKVKPSSLLDAIDAVLPEGEDSEEEEYEEEDEDDSESDDEGSDDSDEDDE